MANLNTDNKALTLRRAPLAWRNVSGVLMTVLSASACALGLIALLAILTHVVIHGLSALSPKLFTELPPPPGVAGGGIANALVGTVKMVALGLLFSLPLSLLAAVYLSEYARDSYLSKIVRGAVQLLASTPSILIGLFAYAGFVVFFHKFSAIAGGFALCMIMIPLLVRAIEEALRAVPDDQRTAALAVGCSKVQALWYVVLPPALPSIITGIMLALARAAGESAPLIFTALFSQFWTTSLMEPTASVSVLIYNFATSPFKNQQELAWGAAFVLVVLLLTINIAVRLLANWRKNK